LMSKVNN